MSTTPTRLPVVRNPHSTFHRPAGDAARNPWGRPLRRNGFEALRARARRVSPLLLAATVAAGLAACDDPGAQSEDAMDATTEAAEETGEALGATLSGETGEAERALEEAGEEMGEAAREARRAAGEAAEEAGDEIEAATDS